MANYYYEQRVGIMCASQFAEIVLNWVGDLATPPSKTEAAAQLNAIWNVGGGTAPLLLLRSLLSEDCFISSFRCRQISPVGGNTINSVFEQLDFPGLVASPIAAQQVAACIIWVNSATPDRTGRTFIPGIPKSALESSRFTSGYTTAVLAFANRLLGGLTVALGSFNLVTLDRVTKTGPLVENTYLSLKVGTQRRREVSV